MVASTSAAYGPPPHLLGPLGLISYITCTARPLYSAGLRKLPILFIPLVLAPPNTDYVAVTCPLHAEVTLLTASMPPPPHCNLHIFVARILLIVLIVLRYQYIDSAGTIAVCSRPDIGIAANTPSALRPTSLGGPIICSWSVSYNAPSWPPPLSHITVSLRYQSVMCCSFLTAS
jgi:hypothetical protein